jgi:hypothetical protein
MPEEEYNYRLYESPINETVETKLCFGIYNLGVDPDESTKLVGLEPTHISRKGESPDPDRRPKAIAKQSSWHFHSALPESAGPEEHLKQLLGVLMKHKEALIPLTERYDCEFGYTVFHA